LRVTELEAERIQSRTLKDERDRSHLLQSNLEKKLSRVKTEVAAAVEKQKKHEEEARHRWQVETKAEYDRREAARLFVDLPGVEDEDDDPVPELPVKYERPAAKYEDIMAAEQS